MSDFERDWKIAISADDWLRSRGYALVERRGPEGMMQGLTRYHGASAEISIVADRGRWFVEVRPDGAPAGRYDFECWSFALGAPISLHTEDWDQWTSWQLAPQLEYLRNHLSQIEAECEIASLDATVAKLREGAAATAAFPPTSRDIGAR